MGFKDRFGRFGGAEVPPVPDAYADVPNMREDPTQMQPNMTYGTYTANMGMPSNMGINPSLGIGGSMAIKVECPTSFAEASRIAQHLLNNNTVMLNLEQTDAQVARRLLDFLSGVAFSRGGQLQRVATCTFCITPSDVDLTCARYQEAPKPMQNDHFGEF